MNTQLKLLADIDAFCKTHQLNDSEFGRMAFNNVAFVHYLRKGRSIKLDTYDKALKFMKSYRSAKPRPRKAAANTVAA